MGIILIITLFLNLYLIYVNDVRMNKASVPGNRLNMLCYFFLLYFFVAIGAILYNNFSASMVYDDSYHVYYNRVYFNYFGILLFGILIAGIDLKTLRNEILWEFERDEGYNPSESAIQLKKILKIAFKVFCYLTLIQGIYFSYILFFGSSDVVSGVWGMFVGQFALFYVFIFLGVVIFLLKMKNRLGNPRSYKAVALIGLTCSVTFLLPFSATPFTIYSAENQTSHAFGPDWKSTIPSSVEREYFLPDPYPSALEYFLGKQPKDCEVDPHVLFYKGTEGVDEGLRLHFDAYMPKGNVKELPGNGSIIIWIHGGGWVIGDKGNYRVQINRYFAAQGYVVFDIQYGLTELDGNLGGLTTPDYVQGDFSINDMVRHIGIFTKYLTSHSNEYNANLNSVFITGGSAGGHLTCATALSMSHGHYEDYFSPTLKIKGYIPLYPGNGLPSVLGIEGDEDLINPENLVEKNSPPCLIFQGTSDGLVPPSVSERFQDAYEKKENDQCAILWMPLAGHASDIYFPGYYNRVYMYYLERFLYVNR